MEAAAEERDKGDRVRKLPKKIPTSIPSLHGPVSIVWISNKKMKKMAGEFAWGLTVYAERKVYLNEIMKMPGADPILMWKTFHHEAHHIHMEDAGMNQVFNRDQRELVCELYAQTRVLAMQRGEKL